MPIALPSKFQEYQFTKEEVQQALIVSPMTRCWLENELTVTMLRKVALIYNAEKEIDWRLTHAELDGRIGLLAELLQVDPIALITPAV